jgi:hypothetical protein
LRKACQEEGKELYRKGREGEGCGNRGSGGDGRSLFTLYHGKETKEKAVWEQ